MVDPIRQIAELMTHCQLVDLSQTFEEGMSRNPILVPFLAGKSHKIETDGFYQQTLTLCEHVGTHVDAPAHTVLARQNETIDTLPADYLIGQAVVYHLADFDPKPGELITGKQILKMEKNTGVSAKEGDIVLLHYGWDKHWACGKGWQDYSDNAPGIDESAARLFYDRKVKAVGSDTATCDFAVKDGKQVGTSYGHSVLWLPSGILIIECLCNLHLLPSSCYFMALPLKIKGGSGSPLRAVALVPR